MNLDCAWICLPPVPLVNIFVKTFYSQPKRCMKKDDSLYLRHILDAIQDIESYVQGIVTLEAFSADGMRLNAVVRQLEVVGEAAAHLSMELRATHADVPWEKMIGMRNRLIHEYFG